MSRHSDNLRIRHMLDHAREAVELSKGKRKEDFMGDRVLQLALVRLVEIVGEASARVSKRFRDGHGGIPWQDISGMRNRLIHGYDSVDLDVLWDTITDDLPQLIAAIEGIKTEDFS